MPESQNIEYKSTWHDDWLKWICGFANSNGGVIFIGKDDKGNIVGVDDYKRLMDDLPNKIRNILGIAVDVNLHEEQDKYYIEIITKAQSVAISLRGRYYKRSGSVNIELTGVSLNDFLFQKSGTTWDNCIEERATIEDIDERTVKRFINLSQESFRLPDISGLTTLEILDKLRLSEDGKLKKAAIILFGKDPGKFYPNIYLKIGQFGSSDVDLLYEVVEEGNLFKILENVIEHLTRKFFKNRIIFEGLYRKEISQYPIAAIREMLLNALVHKNYLGTTIQMRIYDGKINIWNEGTLPNHLTIDLLKKQHPSIPRNPLIADVCYKSGLIDTWGRGIQKIFDSCKDAGLPEPEIKEVFDGIMVELYPATEDMIGAIAAPIAPISAPITSEEILTIMRKNPNITINEISKLINKSIRTVKMEIKNLKQKGKLIRVGTTRKGYWSLTDNE